VGVRVEGRIVGIVVGKIVGIAVGPGEDVGKVVEG